MSKRIELNTDLKNILGSDHVYFQPPANLVMEYPAIVYELSKVHTDMADNIVYHNKKCYTVTLIHKNPDNDIFDKLLVMRYSSFNRHYVSNNLHHYVFEIYY